MANQPVLSERIVLVGTLFGLLTRFAGRQAGVEGAVLFVGVIASTRTGLRPRS
jgi:hypothetical protein